MFVEFHKIFELEGKTFQKSTYCIVKTQFYLSCRLLGTTVTSETNSGL